MKLKTLGAAFVVVLALLGSAPGTQASPSVVRSLDGFHSSSGAAFSLDGSLAYVVQNDDGIMGGLASLVVVDTTTLLRVGEPLATGITGAGVNHAIVMAPNGMKAYLSLGEGKVLPFWPSTLTFGSPITVGTAGTGQIVFTPDGTRAYVAVTNNGSGTTVKVIDVASDAIVTSIAACTGPDGVVITPDGATVFVNCSDGNLVVIETLTNSVANTFTPTGHLQGTTIAMSPDGSQIYATAFGIPSTLTTVINTATLATEHVFTNEPKDLAFSGDANIAYIFSAASGDLIPTDPSTFAANGAIDVTPPRPGDWFLVDRNPVSEQYWITGGNFVYVVGEPAELAQTGFDSGQILTIVALGALLLGAGMTVMMMARRLWKRA